MEPFVVGEGLHVDLLAGQAAGGTDGAGLRLRPGDERLGGGVGVGLRQLPVDDVAEEHPARRTVVHGAPRTDHPVAIAQDDVLPDP